MAQPDSTAVVALLAKRVAELQQSLAELVRQPGPAGVDGSAGRDGRDGKDGLDGKDGRNGVDGKNGRDGRDGADGKDGAVGPAPKHEWRGTKLRFQQPDGAWGKLVDLQGPKGERGPTGYSAGGGSWGYNDTPATVPPPTTTTALRMYTTRPLRVSNGQLTLPSMPLGDVVWNQALVYLDLTPGDLDGTGALRGDRNYLVEEHAVRTEGRVVHFVSTVPDGLHAVVSYLGTAYD